MTNNDNELTGERLQRVLAARGVASRRASEDLITEGRVTVNGKVVTELGTRVDPKRAEIRVDGNIVREQRPRFIILNKPGGFITTVSDERDRRTVMDLVDVPERVYPVGRLDRDTQGLLLLTNEGDVANRVMHPRYKLTKEYHIITQTRPSDEQLQMLRDGILVEGRLVVPDECRLMRESSEGIIIRMVLHEGMYHVVRRMVEIVGIHMDRLRRVRVGPLTLTGIPSGAWRDLTPGELEQLYQAVGMSPEEADAANSQRKLQLEPVGGYQHAPKIRHPKRYAEVARHNERLASGEQQPARRRPARPADDREGRGFGSRPAPSRGRRTTSGKTRSPQGHRDRRPGGGR